MTDLPREWHGGTLAPGTARDHFFDNDLSCECAHGPAQHASDGSCEVEDCNCPMYEPAYEDLAA